MGGSGAGCSTGSLLEVTMENVKLCKFEANGYKFTLLVSEHGGVLRYPNA